jgi:hypothetical protein
MLFPCLVMCYGAIPTFLARFPGVETFRRIQWKPSSGFGGSLAPDSVEVFGRIMQAGCGRTRRTALTGSAQKSMNST